MRKFVLLFFLPILLFGNSLNVYISAPCACVMNAESGKVLYSKNMDVKIFPASVTKIATALYIIEECDFDRKKKVSCLADALTMTTEKKKVDSNFSLAPYLLESDGTTLYLHRGERLTIESLLFGMMVRSANDAANVLALTFAPSIEEFTSQMNAYLRSIGCKNTHFVNPHGLHHPDHYTTAHDLAIILQRALAYPFFRELTSTRVYNVEKTSHVRSRKIISAINILDPKSKYYIPSVIGAKTGYHRRAKSNIAAFGKKNNRMIITILNKGENRLKIFDDCRKLFNSAFEEKRESRVLFNAKESVFTNNYSWAKDTLKATLKENVQLSYYPSEGDDIDVKVHWKELVGPIEEGDVVATLDVYNKAGSPIAQANIYANHKLSHKFWHLARQFFNNLIKMIAAYPKTSVIILLGVLFIFKRRRIRTTS